MTIRIQATLVWAILAVWLAVVGILIGCRPSSDPVDRADSVDWRAGPATYVGRDACKGCHEREFALFEGSHHDRAMDHATESTVLGDFGDTTFTYNGVVSRFYREGDVFFVETDGPDGAMERFPVSYVFGFDPLQQYLIEFPDGRIQCLGIAWDSRPEEMGGQRWFHLYPGEEVDHRDVLHWTRVSQEWNYMCADCHSTDLRKNYDELTDTYATSWSEIDVSCEACHGPASRHLAWAEAHQAGEARVGTEGEMGLYNSLKDTGGGLWMFSEGDPIARRTLPPDNEHQLETCARCHSLRTQLRESPPGGQPLLDDYELRLLDEGLYYPDGQIRSEVYAYGSFIQSKMHQAGVRCTDCHDPHSVRLKAKGNMLCAACHLPSAYDTPDHHSHRTDSAGARCVECHMPDRHYMVVDPRRDHSMRIPRPDVSLSTGSPNACNRCHTDRDAAWSLSAIRGWVGEDWPREKHYGEALQAGRMGAPGAMEALVALIDQAGNAAMVRATAITLAGRHPNPALTDLLFENQTDDDPLIRMTVATAAEDVDPYERLRLLIPLLDDPVLSVRQEAVAGLMEIRPEWMTGDQAATLAEAIRGSIELLHFNVDHPSARVRLGYVHQLRGEARRAADEYRAAIRLEPGFAPAYVNLADLYRQQRLDSKGEAVLRAGLAEVDAAILHHALGLLLVRTGRLDEALASLARAAALEENDPRLGYVYAVALWSTGDQEGALESIDANLKRHPYDPELLRAAVSYLVEADRMTEAELRASQLLALDSENTALRQFLESLGLQLPQDSE